MKEKWKKYIFDYDWEGDVYTFTIPARSPEEAMGRLRRLPMARLVGIQTLEVHVPWPIRRLFKGTNAVYRFFKKV